MSKNTDQNDWRQDPRIQQMDQEKLNYVQEFAMRIQTMPKDQVLPAFLSLQADCRRRNIRFTDSETELLVSILTAGMSPAEKKKLETLKFLAKKMAARSS